MNPRIVAVALALLLVACQSGSDNDTAAPVPVETTAPTTTTTATPTTMDPKLGSTQRYESADGLYGGRITVYRYRDGGLLVDYLEEEITKDGKRTVAVEVRVCVDKTPEGEQVPVSWQSWSLGDDSGGSYEAWSSYSDDLKARPVYPDEKITPEGTCRRGWVPFEIDKDAKPTFVEYNTGDGDVLTWPLEK